MEKQVIKPNLSKSCIALGELIREYREKKGLTQLDVAYKLDCSSSQLVSLFERGLSRVPMETLGFLIELLNIPEKEVVVALVQGYKEEFEGQIPLDESNTSS